MGLVEYSFNCTSHLQVNKLYMLIRIHLYSNINDSSYVDAEHVCLFWHLMGKNTLWVHVGTNWMYMKILETAEIHYKFVDTLQYVNLYRSICFRVHSHTTLHHTGRLRDGCDLVPGLRTSVDLQVAGTYTIKAHAVPTWFVANEYLQIKGYTCLVKIQIYFRFVQENI